MIKINIRTVCVIGQTGVGKSSVLNSLCGEQTAFKVSPSTAPCTKTVSIEEKRWFGDNTEDVVRLIDTPGQGDPNDEKHVYDMIEIFEKVCTINAFVIVLNGATPRFDTFLKGTLNLFKNLFGSEFFKNVVIVFTNWPYDGRSVALRRVSGVTEKVRTEEWNKDIKENFGFDTVSCPIQCVFLDNHYNNPEIRKECEDSELQRFQQQLRAIKQFSERAPYEIIDPLKKGRFEKLKSYFDEPDFHKPPSFVYDIYSILKEFDDKDDSTRIIREYYAEVLAKEVQNKLLDQVVKSLEKILETTLKEDMQKIENLDGGSSLINDILGYGGSAIFGAAGGGGAALIASAVAATGLGVVLIGAGAGIYTAFKLSWKRQTLLEELAPKFRNQIFEGEFRKKVEEAVQVTYSQLVRKGLSQKIARDNKGNNLK